MAFNQFLTNLPGWNSNNAFLVNLPQQIQPVQTGETTLQGDIQKPGLNNTSNEVLNSYSYNKNPFLQNIPVKQNSFLHNHPLLKGGLQIADSSLGRGIIAGGLTALLGGDYQDALTTGLNSGTLNYKLRKDDSAYRDFLIRNGFNPNGIKGYMSQDNMKSFVDINKLHQDALYKQGLIQDRSRRTNAYEGLTESQKGYYDARTVGQDIENVFAPEQKQAALDKLKAEGEIAAVDAASRTELNEAKIKNINAKTGNLETKTEYIPKEYGLQVQKVQNQNNYNNRRLQQMDKQLAILQQRAARGDSLAKQQLEALRIERHKEQIKQDKLINKILQDNITEGSGDSLGVL